MYLGVFYVLVSSARGFPRACCCTGNSIIVVSRLKLVYTRKKGCLVLALVLKISSHQVVMFHIECQFTGTHRPLKVVMDLFHWAVTSFQGFRLQNLLTHFRYNFLIIICCWTFSRLRWGFVTVNRLITHQNASLSSDSFRKNLL